MTSANQQIRIANDQDTDALYALLQEAYAPLLELGIYFSISQTDVEGVRAVIRQETTYVLEGEQGLLATISVRFPWINPARNITDLPFLHWFAVRPSAKQQGVGSQLLTQVENILQASPFKSPAVYLATASQHPWLVALYQRRGYQAFETGTSALGTELVYLRKGFIDTPIDSVRS